MDEKIIQQIIQRKLKGSTYHEKFYETFKLLKLQGYATQQAYRKVDEQNGYIEAKNLCIDLFQITPDYSIDSVHIGDYIAHTTSDSNISTINKQQSIRMIFEEWLQWELETITFLTNCYQQVESPTLKSFIEKLQKQVIEEYHDAAKFVELHSDREWSIQFSSSIQAWLVKKYEPLLDKELLTSSQLYKSEYCMASDGLSLADLEDVANRQVY